MHRQGLYSIRWLPVYCLGLGLLTAGCGSPLPSHAGLSVSDTQSVHRLATCGCGQSCACGPSATAAGAQSQACRCACPCVPSVESGTGSPVPLALPGQASAMGVAANDINEANALSRAAVEAARDGKYDQAVSYLQLAKAKLVSVNLGQLTSGQRTEVVQLLDQIDRALARVATAG